MTGRSERDRSIMSWVYRLVAIGATVVCVGFIWWLEQFLGSAGVEKDHRTCDVIVTTLAVLFAAATMAYCGLYSVFIARSLRAPQLSEIRRVNQDYEIVYDGKTESLIEREVRALLVWSGMADESDERREAMVFVLVRGQICTCMASDSETPTSSRSFAWLPYAFSPILRPPARC